MLKKKLSTFTLGMMIASLSLAQTAKVQVIHNCADAAAAEVDVYINGILEIDNFAFRKATQFLDLPAGVPINVGIAPSISNSVNDTIASFNYNLMNGSNYVLVASGIVSPSGYNPNPNFNLEVFPLARLTASNPANTDILVMHGATDAPTVDIKVPLGSTLVNDISYPNFSADYLELPTSNYNIQVRNAAGTDVVAEYQAPLTTLNLQGQALVVLASGFLNPANNSGGANFGLWAALATGGDLVQLPSVATTTTRVQVIHNCADAAAATVDVWLNDGPLPLIDNFEFRKASAFIDAPSGVDFDIVIQPSNSVDTTNALARFTYNLSAASKYILVANGTVSATGYNPVQPFNLHVFTAAEEASGNSLNTNVLVYHGATDAPTVDIVTGTTTLVNDITYASFNTSYLQLPTADYTISVTDASGANTVATYGAPLATLNLQGNSLVALASGFLNPANNSNGPAFGLWVALPTGGDLIPLPTVNTDPARVQVIHNCADAAAASVDIWLNDSLLINNFNFRTASPFIDAPSGVAFDITVQPSNSVDTTNGLARFTYTLAAGEKYILVANGTVSGTGYNPVQPFNIDVYTGAEESSGNPTNTNILVYHGATDAPTVDIVAGPATLVDDIAYAEFDADYISLPTSDYQISVTDATGAVTVATYSAPLSTLNLGGASLVALASGFLTPANNSNGADFGIWVALPAGGNLIPLPLVTSLKNINESNTLTVYPNPASDKLMIAHPSLSNEKTVVNIFNQLGEIILSQQIQTSSALQATIDVDNISNGLYTIEVVNKQTRLTNRISILK
ncbi:MAG TPA: DUF4397 domain-containing protein [Bacteroidia bacterium]|nr:DUF4397 domain-containing protein [Bacteroidia bacterium]